MFGSLGYDRKESVCQLPRTKRSRAKYRLAGFRFHVRSAPPAPGVTMGEHGGSLGGHGLGHGGKHEGSRAAGAGSRAESSSDDGHASVGAVAFPIAGASEPGASPQRSQ